MTHKHEMNKQIIRKGKEQNCFTVTSANQIFAFENNKKIKKPNYSTSPYFSQEKQAVSLKYIYILKEI